MKPLRVALIGAGIAERHLAGYRWMPERFDVPGTLVIGLSLHSKSL